MNVSTQSTRAVAIALAAICLASSAGAGPLLCEEVTSQASVQSSCPDRDGRYVKANHRIDSLFDPEMPSATSILLNDWSSFQFMFKFHKKADERRLHLWHPLWSRSDLGVGQGFDNRAKWTHAQVHGGQPSQSVPEPSSLLLLGIGLIGAALSRRLR